MGSCLSTRLNERGPPQATGLKLWLPPRICLATDEVGASGSKSRLDGRAFGVPPEGDEYIVPQLGLAVPSRITNTPSGVSEYQFVPFSAPQNALRSPFKDRSGSWSLEVPAGAYAPIPVWTSSAAWFDAVMDALQTPEGEELRRQAKVAPDTLLRVANADRVAADVTTGRGVATAHETVATVLGMCKKTVQRVRGLLEALGLAVTVVEGRYLTVAERKAAERAHGGRQIRAASVRALTMPKDVAVENVHLPRRGSLSSKTPDLKVKQTRASALKSAASRRPPASTKGTPSPKPSKLVQPRSLQLQRFAGQLVARMRWLGDGRHIGRVCQMLEKCQVDPDRWTVAAFIDAINRGNTTAGVSIVDPADQRDPVAYLAWQIRRAIDPDAPTLTEEAHFRAIQAQAEREARRLEREADAQRWANRDEAAIQAAIDQMHAEHAERERHKRANR
jgi:hypothetical protein